MKCIYAIINLKNGKKYIGSTTNFSRRKKAHLYLLGKNEHHSLSLQLSYIKNGSEFYEFIILEKLENNMDMYKKEQYYLDLYKTYDKKYGYNMSKLALNPQNINPELEVYQYDFNYNFIKKYNNCIEASNEVKFDNSGISACCRGKYRYYGGFVWFYKKDLNDENIIKRINIAKNPLVYTEERKLKLSIAGKKRTDNKKPILQYDLNMNFIKEWESALQINQVLGYSSGQICEVAKNKRKTAKGFIWKYKNE